MTRLIFRRQAIGIFASERELTAVHLTVRRRQFHTVSVLIEPVIDGLNVAFERLLPRLHPTAPVIPVTLGNLQFTWPISNPADPITAEQLLTDLALRLPFPIEDLQSAPPLNHPAGPAPVPLHFALASENQPLLSTCATALLPPSGAVPPGLALATYQLNQSHCPGSALLIHRAADKYLLTALKKGTVTAVRLVWRQGDQLLPEIHLFREMVASADPQWHPQELWISGINSDIRELETRNKKSKNPIALPVIMVPETQPGYPLAWGAAAAFLNNSSIRFTNSTNFKTPLYCHKILMGFMAALVSAAIALNINLAVQKIRLDMVSNQTSLSSKPAPDPARLTVSRELIRLEPALKSNLAPGKTLSVVLAQIGSTAGELTVHLDDISGSSDKIVLNGRSPGLPVITSLAESLQQQFPQAVTKVVRTNQTGTGREIQFQMELSADKARL